MQHQRDVPGIVAVLASVGLVFRVASPVVVLFLLATLAIFEDRPMSGFEHVAGLQEWPVLPVVVDHCPVICGK